MTNFLQTKNQQLKLLLPNLKRHIKSQDIDAIDKSLAELNSVWQVASEEMYKNAQSTAQPTAEAGPENQSTSDNKIRK